MLKPSSSFGTLPNWLLRFESLYDRPTGGWRVGGDLEYGSVELEVGRLWHSLVLLHAPNNVLETGTFRGYSTSCIASALDSLGGDRVLYTIDPAPLDPIWSGTSIEKYIRLIRSKSQDAFRQFQSVVFDMMFLDSDHHYDTAIEEIRMYEPMLAVGGLILMHDVLFFDGVGAALKQLILQDRFEYLVLDTPRHHGHKTLRSPGVALLRKKKVGPPPEFNIKFSGMHIGNSYSAPLLENDS